MKKYAAMGFLFFFMIAICAISIRSAQAIDTQSSLHPTINPTEYIRRVTEAAYKKLTVYPTLNPTQHALYLTQAPIRKLTEAARRPTLKPTVNPTEYVRRVTEAAYKKPTISVKPSMNPTSYIRMLSGTPERKPIASPSGIFTERREENKKKLADEKLKVCLAKSEEMKKRSEYLVHSVIEIEKKFTSIVAGVEHYYKEKIIPLGVTLPNYETLIADIAAREKVIGPLLEKAQADVANFSCTGEDPHGQLKQLDTDVRAVLQALQEYRTGIHNLMTALREFKIVEPSVTPKPTINILPGSNP